MEFVLKVTAFVYYLIALSSCRIITSRQPRLSVLQAQPQYYYNNIDGHPGTYEFGYDVPEDGSNNGQFRTEKRHPNGTVTGTYGYYDGSGRPQRYSYIADERGYRVKKIRQSTVPPRLNPVPLLNPGESSITWSKQKNTQKKKVQTKVPVNYINVNKVNKRPPVYIPLDDDTKPIYLSYS